MNEISPDLISHIARRLMVVDEQQFAPSHVSERIVTPMESSNGLTENGLAPHPRQSPKIPWANSPSTSAPVLHPSHGTFEGNESAWASPPHSNVELDSPLVKPAQPLPQIASAGAIPREGASERFSGLKDFVAYVRGHQYRGIGGAPPSARLPQRGPQRFEADGGAPSSEMFSVQAVRRDFPVLNQMVNGHPLIWLDNAATTQKPQAVINSISHYYANDNSNIHRGAHTLAARSTDAFEEARQKIQRFLGAQHAAEIVLVRGTTEAINLVAQTFGREFLNRGDEIVLSQLEHHANIAPWQLLAKERGLILRVAPVNDRGEILLDQYHALLNQKTKLVALAHASNSLGTVLPVYEMTQAAKSVGAHVLIDGAQTVAHLPVNVRQLGADFYVFSGHKIFGPTGIGALYARHDLLERMPPWHGGGNMIKDVTFEHTTYSQPPAKFEAGTPNIADTVGLGAALDYVQRLGLSQIARHEHELLSHATSELGKIPGLRIIGTAREKIGVVSFVLAHLKPEEVGQRLDKEGIAVRAGHHCAQPSLRRFGVEATVRPSFAFYNTHEEVERLTAAVYRIARRTP